MAKKLTCISCGKEFDSKSTVLFVPLKYFEENCVCDQCLKKATDPIETK